MNRRKQFRAVATRFDKLAVGYQATICVADIFIWLRAKPDQPRSDPRTRPSRPRSHFGEYGRPPRCGNLDRADADAADDTSSYHDRL